MKNDKVLCISQYSPEKRTNRTIYQENYYKELTHAIMEAGKSQGLQCKLASWRPTRGDGIVPI